MTPAVFRPSPRLQTKLFVVTALAGILAVVGLALFVWLVARDEGAPDPAGLALVVAVLVNVAWMIPVSAMIPLYCRSLVYEACEDEVIVHVGVINRSVKHVPYRAVTNLEVTRGPFDRLFGLGTLKVQTAGMSGQRGAEESLIGLPNVDEVYDRVAGALRCFHGDTGPDQASVELVAAAPLPVAPANAIPPLLTPQDIRVTIDNREVLALIKEILKEVRIIRHNVQ